MTAHTVIYEARIANKRARIFHRFFNDRNEYAVSITGGKWNVNTLYQPSLGGSIRFMRSEISARHPKAAWHVMIDNTDVVS